MFVQRTLENQMWASLRAVIQPMIHGKHRDLMLAVGVEATETERVWYEEWESVFHCKYLPQSSCVHDGGVMTATVPGIMNGSNSFQNSGFIVSGCGFQFKLQ